MKLCPKCGTPIIWDRSEDSDVMLNRDGSVHDVVDCLKVQLAAMTERAEKAEAKNAKLREACQQLLVHVEADEVTHGRTFAAGRVARAALAEKEQS